MKLNVIVIDDSAVQLALSSKLIEQNEHLNLVGAYANPFLGLNAVNSEEVDFVLLDVEMPEIDGFSLQKLFKDGVEVVINSTRASFELEAYTSGAIDFLQKPLTASKLHSSTLRVFELKRILEVQSSVFNTVAS